MSGNTSRRAEVKDAAKVARRRAIEAQYKRTKVRPGGLFAMQLEPAKIPLRKGRASPLPGYFHRKSGLAGVVYHSSVRRAYVAR